MLRITKEELTIDVYNSLPNTFRGIFSNWIEFSWYRATLKAILERGYLNWEEDKVEWAYIIA